MTAKRKTLSGRTPKSHATDVAIGARVRAFRLERQLTQSDLGAKLGVTFQQIQKYERGTNRVAGSRLVELCAVLQVKPEQILGNGQGVYHTEPDMLELLGDKNTVTMLLELNRLPKSQRVGLLQILRTIAKTFAGKV